MEGRVKWFSDKKGYGFIVPDDNSEDVFVHHSGIIGEGFKTLPEGARVVFDIAEDVKTRKTRAVNVRVVSA